ncbi:hypothetical protein [Catalinimonas niigatensis]|uniref:hypothetical protein n=1 Tax=Catalinimonas niigatensis TaxID=1397264 RepID=UPI0026662DD9|nr:hypothetical protein [Catalinimonas niigatensis]WPP53665.1 hypothetical protein PZB72_13460 [Catalinimonas niigatensis]
MISSSRFMSLSLRNKIQVLYREGTFVVAIRYYSYKVNLYLLCGYYVEVFYNHKDDKIEKIDLLESSHTRMKFYTDQISLPKDLL